MPSSATMPNVKENYEKICEIMSSAAQKSGRTLADIAFVAVTKNASVPAILEARDCGIKFFAENRVQDAQEKVPQVTGVEWQMIGHLQSNKIPGALALFSMIQSVDSVRLAEKIDQELLPTGRVYPVLLEVNVSGEPQKHGFLPEEIYAAVDGIKPLTQLDVQGVMGIAPNTPDPEERRAAFKKLKGVFTVLKAMRSERFQMKYLSMGMSDDLGIAIEEGSNMVRIGSALFGAKK